MKIRRKIEKFGNELNYLYEIDDDKGNITEINVTYLDATIKILQTADKKTNLRNSKSFEKFILNLKRATEYYDKELEKSIQSPNIISRYQDINDANRYREKHLKYDARAKALFSTHSGWYENLPAIIQEIKDVLKENYDYISNDTDLLYTANRIDAILNNYRKKQKIKTL